MRLVAATFAFGVIVIGTAASCSDDPASSSSSTTSSSGGDPSSSNGSSGTPGTSGNPGSNDIVDTTDETMVFAGKTRRYLLSKPKQYDAKKTYPLVLNFHGNPATPEAELAAMPYHVVTKEDAIVAYPAAANGADWAFERPEDGNPDMPWIKPLIEEIGKKVNIDPKNVLGFGYSGGAYFLSQFACRVGGVLKMVAIVSGGAPDQKEGDELDPVNDCVVCAGGPIPAFIAHGVNDQSEVPFEGGNYARMCWSTTNGCNADDLSDATEPCKTANGCGKPVTWCPVPNHGHEAWSDAMARSWAMFRALP